MPDNAREMTFVVCDRVIEEAGTGKKTIIGVFQNFNFDRLPRRLGFPWFLFAQIHDLDPGTVDITLNVVHDETQGVVYAANMEIPQDHPPNIDIVMEASAAQFQKQVKHVVTLTIGGAQRAYFVLNVILRPVSM